MNFLKKGPELKLAELKVPDFVYDLYYDLKERHLLPLAAVLAISIVVVPIALSKSHSSQTEEEPSLATPSTAAADGGTLTVAKSAPGLREYRRRLEGGRALDPFREASEAAAASEAASSASGASEASAPVTESSATAVEVPVESAPAASVPSEFAGSGTTTVTKTQTKYASETLDVRVVTLPSSGGDASAKPSTQVHRKLPELTMLPSRSTPVAIFMGTSSDGKKALLLVSSDVQSIFGDGQCIVGSQTCQLLALEEGVPETFVYGPQARTYRIEVLGLTRTLSSKPRKASLGKSKGKGHYYEAPAGAGRISAAQPR